jgi:hypothetical protein
MEGKSARDAKLWIPQRFKLNASISWVNTRRKVLSKRRFRTTYRSHIQWSSCPWPLKVRQKGKPETPVSKHLIRCVIIQKTEEFVMKSSLFISSQLPKFWDKLSTPSSSSRVFFTLKHGTDTLSQNDGYKLRINIAKRFPVHHDGSLESGQLVSKH